jgi:YidC/Oxa1 family membrane protein insertase
MSNIWEQFVGYFKDGLTAIADVYSFLGDYRWAAAIITLTLIVRSLLLPLAIKQIRSMREQQRLQPEVARLRQKHKTDRQKMTQEMMALYQREGVNPYAACLPMIAQMPVFIAMYYAIRELKPPGGMPFLLVDLTDKANSAVGGWMLIALMTAAQLLSTRQLNPGQTDQQRRLQMLMPLMFIFLFMGFPAALVLYWATQSTYQLVQQIIMTRDMRQGQPWWRPLWPFGDSSSSAAKSTKKKPLKEREKVPQRVPDVPESATSATPALAGGSTPDFARERRDIAEKRARRRRKKKKRRR